MRSIGFGRTPILGFDVTEGEGRLLVLERERESELEYCVIQRKTRRAISRPPPIDLIRDCLSGIRKARRGIST